MKCNSFFYTIQPLFRRCASLNAELSESEVWSERRSASGACPHWAVRGVRCATLRSALIPSIFVTRGRYFIDRYAGALFPVTLTKGRGLQSCLTECRVMERTITRTDTGGTPVAVFTLLTGAPAFCSRGFNSGHGYKAYLRVQSERS